MIIEKFKDIKIAYMRRIGAYGSENKKFMENFKNYLKDNNLFNKSTVIFGIALDNPYTSPEKQRYDIGVLIEDNATIENLDTKYIDNGYYAIFQIKHTEKDIENFWKNIDSLNISIDKNRPILEKYVNSKVEQGFCEICIPIK